MDGQEVFEMADGMGHAVMQRGDPVRDEIGMLFFVRTLAPQPCPLLEPSGARTEWLLACLLTAGPSPASS